LTSHLYREGAATLNDMKDMLASLPQYQEQREKVRRQSAHRPSIASITNTERLQFSLHLSMAQECMDIFERDKLPVVATVEQVRLSNAGLIPARSS
jgi:syntaxin-binding protein 1